MTDEAMTIAADAAPMPEASSPEASAPDSSAPEPTARGAIERAFQALEAGDKTGAPDLDNGSRDRNPNGTFKAKEGGNDTLQAAPEGDVEAAADTQKQTTFAEPPTRFSPDAKAAWASAPEPVKAEVTRAIKELEGGIQQYQQVFEPYREFDKQLRTNGQTFKEVFDHYTGIESMLAENPLQGLDTICRNMGLSLQEVAAHVMGQPTDQKEQQSNALITELKAEIASLKKEVGGVTSTIQSQREKQTLDQIEAFASEHPRFDELAEDISFFLNSGRANDLQAAYQLAERLNPAQPSPALPAATSVQPTATPQTRKGQLSTSGAPSAGSNPANRKPPASARDALDRAFGSVGL